MSPTYKPSKGGKHTIPLHYYAEHTHKMACFLKKASLFYNVQISLHAQGFLVGGIPLEYPYSCIQRGLLPFAPSDFAG